MALGRISGLDGLGHEDVDPHLLLLLSWELEYVAVLAEEGDVPSVLSFIPIVMILLEIPLFGRNGPPLER